MTRRLPAGTRGDIRGGIACSRQQCRTPGGGLPAPDSYAGSAAPSIAGVCGQPPPIFTHAGRRSRGTDDSYELSMVRMTFLLLSFWMTDGIGSAGGWLDCGH